MAWRRIETVKERDIYSCLSTDTKLDTDVGSILYETDTGNQYEFNGTWYQTGTSGAAYVNPSPGISLNQTRYYTGDPGTTARQVKWIDGIDKIKVYVEGPNAAAAETAAVRVAFNMTTTMAVPALQDRDSGIWGELPYRVATVDEPLEIEFDTPYGGKIFNAVFYEDNTSAITGIRFVGENNEG